MIRFTTNRAISDWVKGKGGALAGIVGATNFQITLELSDQLAGRLLEHIETALREPLSDAKIAAIEQSRRHLLERFPDLT